MHNNYVDKFLQQSPLDPDEEDIEVREGEEYPINESEDEEIEEELPRRRKVVGRMPRRANYDPDMKPPRNLIDTAIPMPVSISPEPFYPMPPPQANTIIYQGGQPQAQPQRRTEKDLKRQAQEEIHYQQMLQAEMYRQQMANRPREKFNQKLLRVANEYARGDGGGSNIQIKTDYFKKPKVDLPSPTARRGATTLNNLNKTIQSVAPKVGKKKKGKW